MENFRHAFSIHYPYWGGFWGWGRGAKPGTINLRGLCHFCPKKWSNFPSTKKISFVLLNITIVQLIITHINLGGAPWNGTFGFFEQCASLNGILFHDFCAKNLLISLWFHVKFLNWIELGINENSQHSTEGKCDSMKCWKLLFSVNFPWMWIHWPITKPY